MNGGARSFSSSASGNWNRGGNSSGNWARNNWNGARNNGNGNWAHNNNNWNGNNWNNWNHGHEFHNNDFWWWGIAPLVGAFWGNWYPGYWDNGNYGYGYPAYYGYDYSSQPQYYNTSQPTYSTPPAQSTMTGAGDEYLNQAVTSFQSGNYREAMRMAGHAIVDEPQSPQAHALLCLSAFASGNYQGAAAEAHAVTSLSGVPSWGQIYGVYQNLDTFTSQLRQLEYDAKQHPQDVHAHFLLGFLYMSMGHRAEAQEQLAQVAQQMPNDKVAANLLSQAGGEAQETASRSNTPQSLTPPQNQPMNQGSQQGTRNYGQPNDNSGGARNPPAGPPSATPAPVGGGNQPIPPSGGQLPPPPRDGGTET
jgi:tetratricopeptide (TPR) repeat protein